MTDTPSPPAKPPLTDSPWFWVYLFGVAALVFVALETPKFRQRQAQVERKGQGRIRAAQNVAGQTPDAELSSAENTAIDLKPVMFVLGGATAVAWFILWRQRWRVRSTALRRNASG
jgi:hypothetical protein